MQSSSGNDQEGAVSMPVIGVAIGGTIAFIATVVVVAVALRKGKRAQKEVLEMEDSKWGQRETEVSDVSYSTIDSGNSERYENIFDRLGTLKG